MDIPQIIHRLEEENQGIAQCIWIDYHIRYKEEVIEKFLENYDFNQNVIDILERINDGKIFTLLQSLDSRNTFVDNFIRAKSIKQYLEEK